MNIIDPFEAEAKKHFSRTMVIIDKFKRTFDYKKTSYAVKSFKRRDEKVMKSNIPEIFKADKSLLNI